MAYTTTNYNYSGVGKLYLKTLTNEGYSYIGNVSACALAVAEDIKELKDYTTLGGGIANSMSRVGSVSGSLKTADWTPENLEIALRGIGTTVASAAVAAEAHTASLGKLIKTNFIYDPAVALVVTNTESTPVVLVLGTDYTLSPAGIVIKSTSTAVDEGDDITIGYTKNKSYVLEALIEAATEYGFLFEGLNAADNGNPVLITIHRVKFGMMANLDMLVEDFSQMDLKFSVLKDSTITGTGLSPFFKVDRVSA